MKDITFKFTLATARSVTINDIKNTSPSCDVRVVSICYWWNLYHFHMSIHNYIMIENEHVVVSFVA